MILYQSKSASSKKGYMTVIILFIMAVIIVLMFLKYSNDKEEKEEESTIAVGSYAPDFNGINFFTKEPINYSDLKGEKVILLDFWSIYCVACLKEIPKLVEIYNKYKDGNEIFFIGVDLDTSSRRLGRFLKDPKRITPYPIVMDKNRAISEAFNVTILPTTIIFDKDGKIKMYHEGYKSGDEKHIEEIIVDLID